MKMINHILLVALPLGFAGMVLGNFFLDKTQYITLLQGNILVIYACAFIAVLSNLKQNPPGKKRG